MALLPFGLIAGALLLAGAPRLKASLDQLPVEQAVALYWEGETPDAESIRDVVDDAAGKARRNVDARHAEGIGFLYWLLGRAETGSDRERHRDLRMAAAWLRESLARSPIQPYVWLRLARVEALLDLPDPPRFDDALRMSLLTARVEAPLILDRLRLGLRYFDVLDAETRGLIVNQMLVARDLLPRAYAAMLGARDRDIERVVGLVRAGNPELMLALEVALAPID